MRRALLLGVVALLGCAGRPEHLPRDVPDPDWVQVFPADGFTYYIDQACLSSAERDALETELARARAKLLAWLGPALAPGDFRPQGEPRQDCPSDWEFGPAPTPGPIDVVVLASGGRCHADRDGITLVHRHLARGDATHELVHYLAGSSWHPLDEGLAVYLTEQLIGPDKGFPLSSRARAYRDLNLVTYLNPRELGEPMSRRDYDVAGAFVGWLIESFGKTRFLRLYAGPARDYMDVYGVSERELVERFWTHVGNLRVRQDSAYYAFIALLQRKQPD